MSKIRSEATRRAAIDLVQKGTPISKVAETYHVSQTCVRNWLRGATTPTLGQTVRRPEAITTRPNLARVRDAIATLSEAGLI